MSDTERAVDRTAGPADPEGERLKQRMEEIRPEVLEKLKSIYEISNEVAGLFESIGDKKGTAFYERHTKRIGTYIAWYDPKARKQVQIDRLKAQLAKLEAEAKA